ncbi:glutamine amidotransferase [Candidatus Pelagibacter sp.]|nr:glutamine amidotransferase [Candidatus Pelagibacter sp.]
MSTVGLKKIYIKRGIKKMCGIAGLIHRGKSSNVGSELQGMLQALKHRGEDSTGYALYGDTDGKNFIMRFKVGENVGEGSSSIMEDVSVYDERKKIVDQYLAELGAKVLKEERTLPYSLRYEISYDKNDLLDFSQKIESIPGVEILSMGKSLEVIKDLGNAKAVCDRYSLDKLVGTHAIGHARMATESGVDIKSAHPFWGYPFSDVSVVHNGQLTNYWNNRRALENKGMRFMSECDSELIAVYIAQKMREGASLEEGMKDSLSGLDGVFTYFVATKDSLGMAKDTMAAKPLVLYESDDLVAMGSEEIAIRSVLPQEIDTYDPFDGEVKVWQI